MIFKMKNIKDEIERDKSEICEMFIWIYFLSVDF